MFIFRIESFVKRNYNLFSTNIEGILKSKKYSNTFDVSKTQGFR